MAMANQLVDVLVVGAGPTGLTLAAQLAAFGVVPRVVDRGPDRARESRALAIQPRTLEVLAGLGISDEMVAHGNRTVQLRIHARGRVRSLPLFDLGLDDTAYPYLLFLSQAETERILGEHLNAMGVTVERTVELVDLSETADATTAKLRHRDGGEELVSARYVVGCDGAHSLVRRLARITFEGGAYPQTFVLADLEADGIEPDAAHVFLSGTGMLFFFPLGAPASWRLLVMRQRADPTQADAPLFLGEVQAIADTYTDRRVRLHDPVWMTNFRLHHRAATRYRAGRIFLGGDAAHIHSPAGAQGMNAGIQDAVNLGWKLAHSLRGNADPELLDTYELERAPIGRAVLRFTDRAFTVATSTNPIVRLARTRVAPAVLPLAAKIKFGRAYFFRAVSQLTIHYRNSPLSVDGDNPPRHGPKAGDRLPDAAVIRDGQPSTLHRAMATTGWHLLLCGPRDHWDAAHLTRLGDRHGGIVTVHHLSPYDSPGALHDAQGQARHRLGLDADGSAQYLVRPDGHVAYRVGGIDLTGLERYLDRWLPVTDTGSGRISE